MRKTVKLLQEALDMLKHSLPDRSLKTVSVKLNGVTLDCSIKGDIEEWYVVEVFTEDSEIDILPLLSDAEINELVESKINDLP